MVVDDVCTGGEAGCTQKLGARFCTSDNQAGRCLSPLSLDSSPSGDTGARGGDRGGEGRVQGKGQGERVAKDAWAQPWFWSWVWDGFFRYFSRLKVGKSVVR